MIYVDQIRWNKEEEKKLKLLEMKLTHTLKEPKEETYSKVDNSSFYIIEIFLNIFRLYANKTSN